MPSYTYQPELPHGLPTVSQVQGFLTPPDTPPNELETMVQELSHGLPSLDTDIVMEDDTIEPMLIDEEPVREPVLAPRDDSNVVEGKHYIFNYELVEFYVDDQGGFVQVARVEEFQVVIEYWGPKEQVLERVSELPEWVLDDLLLAQCQIGDISATSCLAVVDTARHDIFRFIQQ